MEWLTMLIIIIVAAAVIAVGFLLVPWLRKRGALDKEAVETTKMLLELVGLIVKSVKTDPNIKNQIDIVFGVCTKVVQYVEQTMKYEDPQDKKLYAYSAVIAILDQMNIELTDENKRLIEIGIEAAVSALPKTN